jgi:inosose dehydratase
MKNTLSRRSFLRTVASKTIAAGLGAAAFPALRAAAERKLKIGFTCITWGTFPRGPEAIATLEPAVKDIASLGFYSFETFPEILEDWDARGALSKLIDQYQLPLRSGYCGTNLTDPSLRKESVAKIIRLGKMIKKYGGTFGVIAPNSVKRADYNFKEYRTSIIAGLNDHAMALADLGLGTGLHQHTGTCIETRDEVYDVMESANTKVLKFAPDVGQLQKGGADAAKVIKDFLPLVKHMHLKDYSGGEHFAGYCPLGMGKVDLVQVLDLVEAGGQQPNIMVELDSSKNQPMTALETARISKAYLQKQGYTFRS